MSTSDGSAKISVVDCMFKGMRATMFPTWASLTEFAFRETVSTLVFGGRPIGKAVAEVLQFLTDLGETIVKD